MLGTHSFIRGSRSPVVTILAIILMALTAYELAELIIGEDVNSIIYLGLFITALIGVVAVLNDWRKGVYLVLAWILFEDLVRKYLGNNMAIYFAKDALALLLYISFFGALR